MHITHFKVIDKQGKTSQEYSDMCRGVLGESPTFKLMADNEEDTVHGFISITFCDPRVLGVDELLFQDGTVEIASVDNIADYWAEQGHRLDHIDGNTAWGQSIIEVEIYNADSLPSPAHKTTLKRPDNMPTRAEIHRLLDAGLT